MQCWWPYMNGELTFKSTECKTFKPIGRKLKSVIPAKQIQHHTLCVKPNQEIQIDFLGPIFYERWI